MPCDSSITATKMTDANQLAEAMTTLGYTRVVIGINSVAGEHRSGTDMEFGRNGAGQAFATSTTDIDALRAVQRKYSEIGVREWASRRGYSVAKTESDGRKLTLVNRRGK
jgi:hypothetical protein